MPENDLVKAATAAADNVPVGTIIAWAGPTNLIPAGWLICNGDPILQAAFPALCAIIQDFWGPRNDASGQHILPDLRGFFLRGVNGSRTDQFADPDRLNRSSTKGRPNDVGSVQTHAIRAHGHTINDPGHTHQTRVPGGGGGSEAPGNQGLVFENSTRSQTGVTINPNGDSVETRPINAYVHYLIKAV